MKRVLITGSSRGIGRSIALKLANKGTHLILHGRDQAALDQVAAEGSALGSSVESIIADLADIKGIMQLAQSVSEKPVDILVNNAGIASKTQPAVEIDLTEWERVFRVNVTAPFLLIKQLAPKMPRGSSIVNILSGASYTAYPEWSAYCMSKFALNGFTKVVREELRSTGIRVINIYPGSTDTDIWKSIPGGFDRSKMMSPDCVAETVVMALNQPNNVLVEGIRISNQGR
jgi:short-subunit dehydrogenase